MKQCISLLTIEIHIKEKQKLKDIINLINKLKIKMDIDTLLNINEKLSIL